MKQKMDRDTKIQKVILPTICGALCLSLVGGYIYYVNHPEIVWGDKALPYENTYIENNENEDIDEEEFKKFMETYELSEKEKMQLKLNSKDSKEYNEEDYQNIDIIDNNKINEVVNNEDSNINKSNSNTQMLENNKSNNIINEVKEVNNNQNVASNNVASNNSNTEVLMQNTQNNVINNNQESNIQPILVDNTNKVSSEQLPATGSAGYDKNGLPYLLPGQEYTFNEITGFPNEAPRDEASAKNNYNEVTNPKNGVKYLYINHFGDQEWHISSIDEQNERARRNRDGIQRFDGATNLRKLTDDEISEIAGNIRRSLN